jgi:hypothetical protein
MSAWYYVKGGQKSGPFPDEDFQNLISRGTVGPDDLVWKEGMSDWQRASTLPGLVFPRDVSAVDSPPTPSERTIPVTPGSSLPGGPIPDYLPWSIAATLLCCLPAGVGAIYYSLKANSARTTGNLETARSQAEIAKKWLIAAVVIGVVVSLFYFIAVIVGGMHARQY